MSDVFPDPPPSSPPEVWSDAVAPGGMVCAVPDPGHPDGICGMPVESEPCDRHGPPATATPGPAYEAYAAQEAPLPAGWQEPPPTRIAALTAQRDDARKAFAALARTFTQGRQSGWSARISGTVLRRLCVMAMCEAPDGTGLEALAEASELVAERDEARAQLGEVRRIAYQGGQDGESVRRELIAYLEAPGA